MHLRLGHTRQTVHWLLIECQLIDCCSSGDHWSVLGIDRHPTADAQLTRRTHDPNFAQSLKTVFCFSSFPIIESTNSYSRHCFNRHCHLLKRGVSRHPLESQAKMEIVSLQNGRWSWHRAEQGRTFLQLQLIAMIRKTNYPLIIVARVILNQKT